MDLNLLLKQTNKTIKEQKKKRSNELNTLYKDQLKKINTTISLMRKEETIVYRIKDRFKRIYPIFLTIFTIWLLPIIYMLFNLSNPFYFIILIIYIILTIGIGLISITVPVLKFFSSDLPKVIDEIKVYASSNYIVAIIFSENRTIIPILKKLDNLGHFSYIKGDYVTEKSASFISTGKIMVSFYLQNIPNPLKFNFNRYLNEYIKAKRKDRDAKILDWDNKTVDVAFSSENIQELKKNKLFQEFFRDYVGEANKLLFAILGFASLVVIAFIFLFIMK